MTTTSASNTDRARDFNRHVIDEFRAHAGRVGGRLTGTPVILLHDIGARSGLEHVTPVAYTLLTDGSYAIAAANGGSAVHPTWYHNLTAYSRITVEVGSETFTVVAREILGTAREELWPTLVSAAPTLGEFQRKTSRHIPIFILRPIGRRLRAQGRAALWPVGWPGPLLRHSALVTGHDVEALDPDIDEVIRRELMLLDPAVRASTDRILALLHPDFVEFGASGRRWDAASVAASMAQAAADGERIEARGLSALKLADDIVLLTFEALRSEVVSLRSSVWVRLNAEWRLRFHQGTVAAG